jgi:hypothetical protein
VGGWRGRALSSVDTSDVELDVAGGEYYGPGGPLNIRGPPEEQTSSEDLTGVRYEI